ncbi:serine hydrolase FSH [Lasiosphaeria ovina]|uniref:Serine hydrolase FSH n=1 Tax=Lasiosphaeria ovina TaxID=92902 RepID=A0AAE0NJC2_9PEZI|nr:serine hydrolase FSH [Lasiosphaeria ovina]
MRWLCLHGRGTSAQIFEMQTARIRQALGPDHDFVFVNGTVATEPDAGAADVASEFFGYLTDGIHGAGRQNYLELWHGLADVVASQGPFDGLMGFSEGGTVAAMMLVGGARQGGGSSFSGFKCAVLFSAAAPADPDVVDTGVVRRLDAAADGALVKIPTAHLWSRHCAPGESQVHQALAQLCEADVRQVCLHGLAHDVPGSKPGDDEGLQGALRAIERTIESAACG